jgi:hypothetical protein
MFVMAFSVFANATCYEDADKFSGVTNQWCGQWGTEGKMLGGLTGVDPIPQKTILSDGSVLFNIKIVYWQKDWMFIPPNGNLILMFDNGEKVTLVTKEGSAPNRTTGHGEFSGVKVTEIAFYPATKELFEKMSKAKKIDFAVYGERGRVERTLEDTQLKFYAEFLEKYGNSVKAEEANAASSSTK